MLTSKAEAKPKSLATPKIIPRRTLTSDDQLREIQVMSLTQHRQRITSTRFRIVIRLNEAAHNPRQETLEAPVPSIFLFV